MKNKRIVFFLRGLFVLTLIITGSCDVLNISLKDDDILVTGIEISPITLTLEEGNTGQLTMEIIPNNATDQTISWSSSNIAVASVDTSGLVTAVGTGTANITLTTNDGDKTATAEITVTTPVPAGFYSVKFNSMGGSTVDSQSVEQNKPVTKPDDPTRDNYLFEGWYSEEDYLTEWDFLTNMVALDMTLYAKWTEIFLSVDKPSVQLLNYNGDTSKTYKLVKPWNYDKLNNAEREYPIVIGLHGWTSLTDVYFTPAIMYNENQMQDFPCFYLAANNSTLGWGDGAVWIRNLIEELISTYRIDINRVYVIGFSMGGSGSYYFTEDLYDEKDLTVAGIVRCAGMSNYDLPDAIASRTSVWYHYGESDDSTIISYAHSSYDFMKNHTAYEGAYEDINYDAGFFGGYQTNNSFLSLDGVDFMRLTGYELMEHEYFPVFENPEVLIWLFSQALGNR